MAVKQRRWRRLGLEVSWWPLYWRSRDRNQKKRGMAYLRTLKFFFLSLSLSVLKLAFCLGFWSEMRKLFENPLKELDGCECVYKWFEMNIWQYEALGWYCVREGRKVNSNEQRKRKGQGEGQNGDVRQWQWDAHTIPR